MKALSLWQPWASLIAIGAKTIETRGWSTKYRGPLLIHAAKRIARLPEAPEAWEPFSVDTYTATRSREASHKFWGTEEFADALPLGAIVASCQLVDVVPMVECPWPGRLEYEPHRNEHRLFVKANGELWRTNPHGGAPIDVSDQRPYGLYEPGRFAWLLEDVKPTTERCPACWGRGWVPCRNGCSAEHHDDGDPCPICDGKSTSDPIPAKGKQGLWEWTPLSLGERYREVMTAPVHLSEADEQKVRDLLARPTEDRS